MATGRDTAVVAGGPAGDADVEEPRSNEVVPEQLKHMLSN